ncbi:DUF397 domain-containing protein [Saccharomonospora xinjiangensis]|uniref:DUF397 domain-containing protein n=1 Tax=Saccharomonospora xinjiangensis XJ-54 TaxID=882086 RepID=I0V6Z9_9PSEU|nr:DUF397 domain-containing protein [Saccharomonospora xinjiangensis]EID55902.1 protein of unknown function (DUF397) [Saccharomonospora xinjiangensis XJ-54]QBQ61110.1 hypothetical protein EYD13_13790 [Saccharomonospora xinjiangensis]
MVADTDLARLEWRKSSFSGGGNDCVEVAFTDGGAAVRDSKNPGGGALTLSGRQWDAFLSAARAGELDLS